MRGVSRDIVEEILKKAKEGENILPEEGYSPISPIYSPIEDSLNFSFSDIINPEASEESLTSLDFIPAPPAPPREDNKLSSELSLVPEAGWLYTPEELAQDILAPELSTAFQDKDTQFGLELIKHFPTEEALQEDLAKATGLSDEEKQRVLDIYRNTKANLPYIQATTQQPELEPISITSPAQEPTLPQLPQEDYTGELPDFATALEEVKPPKPKLDFTPEEEENVRKHLNFTTALLNNFPDEKSLQEDLKKSSLDEKAQEQVLQLYRSVKEAEPYYRYFSLLPEDIRPKFYLAFQRAIQNNDNPIPFYKKILEEAGYTSEEKLKKLPPLQRTLIEGILNQPDWKITKKDMEDFALNYGLEVLSGALAPISAPLAIGATLGTGLLATKAITDTQKVVDSYALKLIEKYKDNPEIIAKMKEGILPEDIEVPEEYKGHVDAFTSSIDREVIFKQEVAGAVKDFLNGDILQKPITGYELSSFTGDISGVLTRLLFQGPTGAARKLVWVGAEQAINVLSGLGSVKASQYAVEKWGKLAGVPAATLGALAGGTVAHAISAVPRAVVSTKIARSTETPDSIKDMANIKKADLVSDSMLTDAAQQEAQKTALTVPQEAKANLPDAVVSKLQLKAYAEGKQQDELWNKVLPEVPDSFYAAQTVAKDLKEKGELERLPLLTKGLMRLALSAEEIVKAVNDVVNEALSFPEKYSNFDKDFISALRKKGIEPPVPAIYEAMRRATARLQEETLEPPPTIWGEPTVSEEIAKEAIQVFKNKPEEFLKEFSKAFREILPSENKDLYKKLLADYKEVSLGKHEPVDLDNLTQEFLRRNGSWVYRDLENILTQRRASLTAGGTAETAITHLVQEVLTRAPSVFRQVDAYFKKLYKLAEVVFSDVGKERIKEELLKNQYVLSRAYSPEDIEPAHRRAHLTLLSQLGIVSDLEKSIPDPITVYKTVKDLFKEAGEDLNTLIKGIDGIYDLLTLAGEVRRMVKDLGEEKARDLFITSTYQILSRSEDLLSALKGQTLPSAEVLANYFYPADLPFWVQLKTHIKTLQALVDNFSPIFKAEQKRYYAEDFKKDFLPALEKGLRNISALLENGDKIGALSPFRDELVRIANYTAKLRSVFDRLKPDQLKRRIQSLVSVIGALDTAVRSYVGGSLTPFEITSRLSYALGSTKFATLTKFGRGIERAIPEPVRKFFTYYFVSPLSDLPRAIARLFDMNETARREMQRAIEQVYPYANQTITRISRKATQFFTRDVLTQEDIDLLKDILTAGLVVKKGILHPKAEQMVSYELEVLKDIRNRLKQLNLSEKEIAELLQTTNVEFFVNSKLKRDRDLPVIARIVNTNLMHRWLLKALEDKNSLAYKSLDGAGKQFIDSLRKVIDYSYDLLASRGLLPFETEQYKDKYVHYFYHLLNENILKNLDTPIFKEVNAQNALIYLLKHTDYQTRYIERFKELFNHYRDLLQGLTIPEDVKARQLQRILEETLNDSNIMPSIASISRALKYGKSVVDALAYEITKRAIQREEGLPYKPQLLTLIETLLKKPLTQFTEDSELKSLYPYPELLKKNDAFYKRFLLQPKLPERNIHDTLYEGISLLVQHFQRPDITPLMAIRTLRKLLPPEITGSRAADILIPRQYLDLSLKNFLLMNYNPLDAVIRGINKTLNLVHHYDILNKLVAEFKLILPEKEAMKYGDMYVPISAELLAKKYPAVAQRAIKALLPPEDKYYIHKALLEALDEAEALNRFKKNLWTYIRQFLRSLSVPYKIAMAVWNPMVIGANFLGNFIPVVLASRSFSKGIEYYIRGIKGMIAKDADYQELASLGLIRSMAGVFQELVGTRLRPEASHEKFSKFMLNLLDLWSKGKLLGILSKANAFFDDAARLGVYKYLKENGYEIPISELALAGVPKTELLFKALSGKLPRRKLTQEQIVELVKHYSFDYFDIPEGVRAIRDTLMPFASFPYLTLRMYAKTLSENPIAGIRLLFTPALANLSAEVFFNVDPNLDRIVPGSDYLTGSTNILTLFTAPVATVRTLVSHPVIATLWGLLTGRDVYSLREIYDVPSSIWGEQYERFVSIANMLKYIANKAIQNYIPDVWQMLGWQAYYSLHNSDVDLLTTLLEPPWIYKYLTGATSASSHIPKFLRWLYLAGVRIEPINYAKLKLDLIKNIDLSLIRLKSYGRILTRGGSIWRVLGRTPQEIYASYYRTLQHYKDEYRKLQELLQYANTDLLLYRNRLNPIDRWLTRALLQVRSNLESLVKSMKKR